MDQFKIDFYQLSQQLGRLFGLTQSQGLTVPIVIESAIPLSLLQKNELQKFFTQKLHTKVSLENKIKPYLIGGLRIKYQDKLIDGSIKGKLDQLAESLLHD